MLTLLRTLLTTAASVLKSRRDLALENLALRQQLAMFKRSRPRPRLNDRDRLFWVCCSKAWKGWGETLLLVQH